MKEKNFNTHLMFVISEAVKVAKAMAQRRSVAIAGPFPLSKAHQLTQILNRAYSKTLPPVPLNPFMDEEQKEKKAKLKEKELEKELNANEVMPITEEKVR